MTRKQRRQRDAERHRRARARRKDGRVVVPVEVDDVAVAEWLIGAGLIAGHTDDRAELGRALGRALTLLIAVEELCMTSCDLQIK